MSQNTPPTRNWQAYKYNILKQLKDSNDSLKALICLLKLLFHGWTTIVVAINVYLIAIKQEKINEVLKYDTYRAK